MCNPLFLPLEIFPGKAERPEQGVALPEASQRKKEVEK